MMTNNISSTVVELNNGALTHFLNRDYDEAIALLRRAFGIFEAQRTVAFGVFHIDENDTQQASFNFTQTPPQCSTDLPTMDCDSDMGPSIKSLRSIQVETSFSSSSSPCSAFSMYNRALVLGNDEDDFSLLVRHQQRTRAIILYNLALVHHNIGIHLGVSAALPHALRLYEMSLEAIDKDANLVDVQKLLMALLNNMGNIHSHLFHFQNTEKCLSDLRIVLAASGALAAMDEDYIFFFLNALFQGKELCFAPAA